MIKKTIFIFSLLFFKIIFSQKSEPVYYDGNWEVSTKQNASFYRPMPLKEVGELVLIQDFFINGTLQFEGYALKKNDRSYVGDAIWYDKDGNDENFIQYRNDTKNLTLLYYHSNGKLRKKVQYKDGVKEGETVIYSNDGAILMKGVFVKGKPDSGSFENVKRIRDYSDGAEADEISGNSILGKEIDTVPPPPPLPPNRTAELKPLEATAPMEDYDESNSKNKKNRRTVTEKIFWANSKQLA